MVIKSHTKIAQHFVIGQSVRWAFAHYLFMFRSLRCVGTVPPAIVVIRPRRNARCISSRLQPSYSSIVLVLVVFDSMYITRFKDSTTIVWIVHLNHRLHSSQLSHTSSCWMLQPVEEEWVWNTRRRRRHHATRNQNISFMKKRSGF